MKEWENTYKSKLISCQEAAGKIDSGDIVFAGVNVAIPDVLLEMLAKRKNELSNVTIIAGTSIYPLEIFKDVDFKGKINYITNFLGGKEGAYRKEGNVSVNSVHLSRMTRSMVDELSAEVLFIQCSKPDEEGFLYFSCGGTTSGYEVAKAAKKIILQVNSYQPQTAGKFHKIHIDDVSWVCEHDSPLNEFPQPEATETEVKIAQYILPMIEDGSCLQLGIGGLANMIGFSLETRKDLSVWTEMYTDSMVYLDQKGVITGRQVASFALGRQSLYEHLSNTSNVELMPLSIVNDPYEIGKNDKLVSINATLMSDLTGQVCSESLGAKQYSATGGQLDFVRGAALSKGGKSFLCMKSTHTNKATGKLESQIKLALPQGSVVTTPRSDVMYIVTEYGVADLFLKPIEYRVEQMISIAHPDFREELREGAIREGIIQR